MTKSNLAVRSAAKRAGVPLWAVAIKLGVSEPTLIRWLRVPLSAEREQQIMGVIYEIEKEV